MLDTAAFISCGAKRKMYAHLKTIISSEADVKDGVKAKRTNLIAVNSNILRLIPLSTNTSEVRCNSAFLKLKS